MGKFGKIIVTIAIIVAVVSMIYLVLNQPQKIVSPVKIEPIKIGWIGPLTGGPALWGQGSLNMVNLAVDEINARGGIDGRKIDLITEDGKCNSAEAVTVAKKLIEVDRVKFILGGHCSPETVAIVPVINQAKVFLLAGVTSTDEAVSGSKYAFRTSPPTLEQAKKVASTAYDKYKYRKIAMITEEAAYPKSFSSDLKNEFKGEIVYELNFVPLEKDFMTGLAKIKKAKPDAIWIAPQDPNEAVLILQQMEKLGMLNIPLFGSTTLVDKSVYNNSNKLLPSTAWTITLFADPESPKSKELQDKYKARYGKDVPYNLYYVSAAYDATYMLADALRKCGEKVDCVQEYFRNIKGYKGAAGTFEFKDNGDPIFDSWKEMKIIDGNSVLE